MLSAEQARDELKRFGGREQAELQLSRVLRLRGDAGRAGRGLLAHRVPIRDRVAMSILDVGRLIDDLPDGRRSKLFRTVHPPLAELLAAGWHDLRRDPYTLGSARRPIRAPAHPEVSHVARARWLSAVATTTAPYEQEASWFAAWAGHIDGGSPALGRLLGVAIDRGDRAVFDTLVATVRGEHDVAQMGRHVPAALLSCSEAAGWDEVERLLLAAQRQEGLRQVILETVDLAHPDAFRRMLRLISQEGLTRFAATIRAVGVWLGAAFEVRDRGVVDELLEALLTYLDDAPARSAAIADGDAGQASLGLWALAYEDAASAAAQATTMLADPVADRRLAAIRLLAALRWPGAESRFVSALTDEDLRVAAVAFEAIGFWDFGGAAIDPLRALLERLTEDRSVPVGIWKPEQITLTASDVADAAVSQLGDRAPTALRDLRSRMSPMGRSQYATLLAEEPHYYRGDLLNLTGDRSDHVRRIVFSVLERGPAPTAGEAAHLEDLLRRKSAHLRRSVIQLLLQQPDDDAAASAERLLAGMQAQVQAGREIIAELATNGRATGHTARLATLAADETPAAGAARDARTPATGMSGPVGPDDFIDHGARTRPAQPPPPDVRPGAWTDGVSRVLRSLDAWLAEHRDVEVAVESWQGPQVELVSNLRWLPGPSEDQSWEAQQERFPLDELVRPWWERTAGQLTDGGVEALLAWPAAEAAWTVLAPHYAPHRDVTPLPSWTVQLVRRISPVDVVASLQYTPVAVGFLQWFAARELRPGWVDALLDASEVVLAAIPAKSIEALPTVAEIANQRRDGHRVPFDWRVQGVCAWLQAAITLEAIRPQLWSAAQRGRLWRQVRFVDEPRGLFVPSPQARDNLKVGDEFEFRYASLHSRRLDAPRRPPRQRPPLRLTVRAIEDGVATRADLVDLLVGERTPEDNLGPGLARRYGLGGLTRRRRAAWVDDHPWVIELVDGIRDRIVDTEARRGELPTAVTDAALELRSVVGIDTVARLVAGLGRHKLVRGYGWHGDSKPEVFSRLIRASFPADGETHDDFIETVTRHGLKEKRLLELAVYAPQWAPYVESMLGWAGLTDAVHWLHAHTKDDRWQVDRDVREEWTAETHQRTPLPAQDLVNGAVDVGWFARVRERLGDDRFGVLLKAARYASSSGGHKRAELFARALRGEVDRDHLIQRMTAKRHQDSVRALGLLPLPGDNATQRDEVLSRYETLQEWKRESRQFGQQRRASEALAVRVAMENLARTAGYRDPQRLQWAMEAEAVRDLAGGPVSVVEGDVTVSLSIDPSGSPALRVRRGDRALKSVPSKLRKHEGVAELKQRAAHLRDQARRMRTSLEEAAIRGDRFTHDELEDLGRHPALAPMLERLLVVTDEGILGWPRPGSRTLLDHGDRERPVDGSALRVAHAVDLLESGDWPEWQRACFHRHIRQPFKQVFRELYVPTAAELNGAKRSERYAGHQIQRGQATALFGSRGWVVDRESAAIRTFHDEGITAHVEALGVWGTPAEVEDPTIDAVSFAPVGSWEPIALRDVAARLFSETMRDVDLVVSVAHAGGVDPEASASTVEMRGALVRETADMLTLDNIELTEHHVLVRGKLGSYSVHLGSGTVHRRPGNALCIIPVGAQQRGRLFLPFVDDDPRTAEVVSKVVMLARDDSIKDPTILEQLRA